MLYAPTPAFFKAAGVSFVDKVERLWRLDLNGDLGFIGAELIGAGGETTVSVRAADIFRGALVNRAAWIVLIHNHPSGRAEPSSRDRVVTRRLAVAGAMLGATLYDHVLVGKSEVFSFREAGLL